MVAVARAERYTPTIKKKIFYRDFSFTSLFNIDTKDLNMIENEDAVKLSLINILMTKRGERVFDSTFGSDLHYLLFENISPQTTTLLVEVIKTAIDNHEPRVQVIDVTATPTPDENAYAITIVYRTINKTEPVVLDFLLNRVR